MVFNVNITNARMHQIRRYASERLWNQKLSTKKNENCNNNNSIVESKYLGATTPVPRRAQRFQREVSALLLLLLLRFVIISLFWAVGRGCRAAGLFSVPGLPFSADSSDPLSAIVSQETNHIPYNWLENTKCFYKNNFVFVLFWSSCWRYCWSLSCLIDFMDSSSSR